jgi:hypothetical protein
VLVSRQKVWIGSWIYGTFTGKVLQKSVGSGCTDPCFLDQHYLDMNDQLHDPGSFTKGGKAPGIHWTRRRVGFRASLDNTEKNPLLCWGSNSHPLQLQATITISRIFTLCRSLYCSTYTVSCLHQQLPGNGCQQWILLCICAQILAGWRLSHIFRFN